MPFVENRYEKILKTIIAEYIATGEPVGSRTISKRSDIGLSAASIRNVMSDLTESGYIMQPHVSAGRIPTDRGYRFYVDTTVEPGLLSRGERATVESLVSEAVVDFRDLMRRSSVVLAGLSKQAGVVAAVGLVEQAFKTIEFIKVAEDRILVVLVSTSGFVQNRLIYEEEDINQDTLEMYSRMLNDMLKDLDLRQAREKIEQELKREKTQVDAMLAKILRFGYAMLSEDPFREIFIEGQSNILDEPEFAQMEKLKALLATFEEKSRLLKILDKALQAKGVQILIGSEHGLDEIESCSIVAYPIRTELAAIGSIAVIGPKRMNYQKVVSVVDTTGLVLTRLLKKLIESAV